MTRVTNGKRIRVAHEIPGRIRLRGNALRDPALDCDYVTAFIEAMPDVRRVRFNGHAGSIVVEHVGGSGMRMSLLQVLEALPADAYKPDAHRGGGAELSDVLVLGAAAAASPFLPMPVTATMSWFLAIPVFVKGVETLLTRGLKIEVLDATSRGFALLRGDYFTANTVGALVTLGEYVEGTMERRTNDLLSGLLKPSIESVWVERDGLEVEIPFEQTVVGDIVICGPGELLPVDGVVRAGEASVNLSSITGEAVPVHLAPGDEVLSGGLIEDGKLKIEARLVGSETSMARISGYLEKSLRNKSSVQRSNEELADKLVPLTFGAGLGIYAGTGELSRAASVLTVDYSCAVKLSTPVAVRSAMYAAGTHGVLLKGAQALDAMARVDTVVFDKTGTLTLGELEVTDILPMTNPGDNGNGVNNGMGEMDEGGLLALAAGAEEHYTHPVARAVVAAAAERGLELPGISQVDFIVAHGVSAYVDGEQVLVGSRHFIHDDENVDCSITDEAADRLRDQGKSLLFVAKGGRLAGVIAMRDTLRPEARQALRDLKELGVRKLVMLTGDHPRSADAVLAMLPEIDICHADLKPEDKASIVERLRSEGATIAFVGDGVNDAPALLTADVGVSMASGADLARDTAHVLLMKEDLSGLVLAKQLGLTTEATLRQCLWSAVGINSALLALASAGILPAVASAALHNTTTIGILAYAAMRGGSGAVKQLDAASGSGADATVTSQETHHASVIG